MFSGTLARDYDVKLLPADLSTVCVQSKYDGVRVQIVPSRVAQNAVDKRLERSVTTNTCTRSGGYVPNDYIRSLLDSLPIGLDGELMAADDTADSQEAQFSTSMSAISRKTGEPSFKYVVYDYTGNTEASYSERMDKAWFVVLRHFGNLESIPDWLHFAPIHVVPESLEDIDNEVARLVALGHEGAIIRRLDLPHVTGRSSRKQPAVLRIKAWATVEAQITAVIAETYHDCERNRTECSEKIGTNKDFASSFECIGLEGTPFAGSTFRAPLQVTDAVARQYLQEADSLIGKICTVKYLAQGNVSKPRLPGCIGIRENFDIGI